MPNRRQLAFPANERVDLCRQVNGFHEGIIVPLPCDFPMEVGSQTRATGWISINWPAEDGGPKMYIMLLFFQRVAVPPCPPSLGYKPICARACTVIPIPSMVINSALPAGISSAKRL